MSKRDRWQHLANRMMHGTATNAEAAELSVLLRRDSELRSEYLRYLELHANLCWEFRDAETAGLDPSAGASRAASPAPSNTTRRVSMSSVLLPWTIAVLATIVAMVALWHGSNLPMASVGPEHQERDRGAKDQPERDVLEEKKPSLAALLVDQAGAEFADDRGPDGVRFRSGDYELVDGVVHLRYANGADLVIQAPASFQIEDEYHTELASGRVRAIVPPSAHGFTIETSDVAFEDIGTEFAVSVDPDGNSAMQVFDGQVDVRRAGAEELLQSVYEGEWVRYREGRPRKGPALNLSGLPTPGHIGFLRWKAQRRQILADPGLIAWYPFVREANASVLTNAQRSHDVPDGRIASARWVAGRWPGKEALLFDRDADYVQLQIPGEYDALSVAVWLKADRYDRELNAILNSNRWEPGDLHFQLNRYGLPRGGIHGLGDRKRWVGSPVPLAKWTHVVSVMSVPERVYRIYVNGKCVLDSVFANDNVPIRPGACRLGNWLSSNPYENKPPRAFRGRMDELAVWSRALDEEEILELVESGRPSLLWSRDNPPLDMPLPQP
ncbi:FecR protein [Planctomycetes bacterium Pan216]|uniref:FecR protein n=1 Tax=Kolteria novifilia TaxID=2527975 RepID=A0A518AZ36_9BACT|nr:FecR protein [Planctomycetes bacterium Pan216]